MANYVKATDFQAKDALITGNPSKIIKGQEINDEFNAIQTAIATKADLSSPNFLGNPTAPTQANGNNTTRLATTAFVQAALQTLYPVGSIYIAVISTNPATLFGFGTWVAFGAGKALVGLDGADASFDTVEETGGSKDAIVVSHTHTLTDPGHTHTVTKNSTANINSQGSVGYWNAGSDVWGTNLSNTTSSSSTGISIANSGSSGTNANLQPYVVVYMWKRTA